MRLVTCLVAVSWSLVFLGGALPTLARDIFVNNATGDDQLRGRSPQAGFQETGPVRTIGRALRLASRGDRIVLEKTDSPYRESISLSGASQSGYANRPFTIVGGGAVLDGSEAVPPGSWSHHRGDLFRCRPRHLAHQQLFLDGKPARRRHLGLAGDRVAGDRASELAPLEWALAGGYVYFRVEAGRLPEDYDLRYAGRQTGITLYQVEHVRITELAVQGFALDGVNAHDGVIESELMGLNCRANGRSGVSVGGASRLVLRDCVLYDNGRAQFRIEGHAKAWLASTEINPATAPATQIEGGQLFIDDEPTSGH